MEFNNYNPKEEAISLGLTVAKVNFGVVKSFLLDKIIYLNTNLSETEQRCALTYEIVHYIWSKFSNVEGVAWHSKNVEDILRQQAARKLISAEALYSLLEKGFDLQEIAEELNVNKDVLVYYFKYCRAKITHEKILIIILH